MIFIEQRVRFLERIVRRNNEPELVDVRMLQDVVGNDEMANMNGVEGAEIKTNVHEKFFYKFPEGIRQNNQPANAKKLGSKDEMPTAYFSRNLISVL